jgi:hypothetical protein
LIEAIAACARRAGREIASPTEARQIFGGDGIEMYIPGHAKREPGIHDREAWDSGLVLRTPSDAQLRIGE